MNTLSWTTQSAYPIVTTLQLVPLAAMGLMLVLRHHRMVRPAAVLAAAVELLLAIDLYHRFDVQQSAFQFAERLSFPPLLSYHAAVDGVSVLFILLTALLTLIITIYGPVRGLHPYWRFLSVVFAVQATLMGMFTTMNLLWFVLLSAAQLGLVGYLLWRWATSPAKDLMITRFVQFMGTGLLLLMTGALMLGWNYADATGGAWSFDLLALSGVAVAAPMQSAVFFLLFYGLAIRIPLFPFHGWLPLAVEHGNVAVAPVFLLGLKVGVYGLLRFVFPLLPEAVMYWHNYVVAFAVAGIFYAALLAMMQVNLRRLLAFAVVSHTNILVIGLFSLTHIAFQGSVLLSVNFGLATAGLLFMTGLVYRRTGTAHLAQLGGLFDHIPVIGITFLVAGLSIIGMPGTPGFDAAHLVMEAAIERFGALLTIAAALGNVVAAGFLLWAFQRAFLSPRNPDARPLVVQAATPMELFVAGAVIVVLLGAGFYLEPWLELVDTSLESLSAQFDHSS